MAAGNYNFTIDRGATFNKTITWKDSVGNPINLTGYTGRLQLRDKPKGTIYLELNTTNDGITFNAIAGQIILLISATDTASISVSKAMYDLIVTDMTGNVTRLLQGRVKISEEITV